MLSNEALRLSGIDKEYGIKRILNEIHLSLNVGERLAIIGENGTGKTTLLKIITGEVAADSGTVHLPNGGSIGYLPQDLPSEPSLTIEQYIEQAMGNLQQIQHQMQTLEHQMQTPQNPDQLELILNEYGELQTLYQQRGGYELPVRMERVFDGLGIHHLDTERQLTTLSGGERTRVGLAALLLQMPDVLLLDEPTNHLDFDGITWLENYLQDYPYAVIVVTHDREFMNRVINRIAELNPKTHRLDIYHGNYNDYLAEKDRLYENAVESYNQQKNQIKALQRTIKQKHHSIKTSGRFSTDGDKFLKNFKKEAGEDLAGKAIQKARHEMETLQASLGTNPRHEWHIEFRFDPLPLSSREAIRLNTISKGYNESKLFHNVNLSVYHGDRVVLVAPNGSGKSTLLRLLMGFEQPDMGTFLVRGNVGYLDQDGEYLPQDEAVMPYLQQLAPQWSVNEIQAELHRAGLFTDASLMTKPIRALSVGQRRKLGLAHLILTQANVLLLDEPTNHLDPMSVEALEEALIQFEGVIFAVSHDRRFIQKVATRTWELIDGQIIDTTYARTNHLLS